MAEPNRNPKAFEELAAKMVGELVTKMVRDAFDRGRVQLYGELIDDCIAKDRRSAALWLLDTLSTEMRALPDITEEHEAFLEDIDRRVRTLKGVQRG